VPLEASINLLDRALALLADLDGDDFSRAEIAIAVAVVGRLVAAMDQLIRQSEATSFDAFLADHPELM
jgi:hypothetical protein